jgi:fluoride exporter
MTIQLFLAIAIGGGIGSMLRFLLLESIQKISTSGFPFGILLINVLGCFSIGLLTPLIIDRFHLNDLWRSLILIGFLGGFTTFSSFSIDAVTMLRQGFQFQGILYIFSSMAFCLLATWLGIFLVK